LLSWKGGIRSLFETTAGIRKKTPFKKDEGEIGGLNIQSNTGGNIWSNATTAQVSRGTQKKKENFTTNTSPVMCGGNLQSLFESILIVSGIRITYMR